MKKLSSLLHYFTLTEKLIWLFSVALILLSLPVNPDADPLSTVASIIGVTSLIFCAKGHPIGQGLIIVFSALYGVVSFRFAYYGEVLTYVGMTLPMAVLSLISWLKNPYEKGKSEVRVNPRLRRFELFLLPALALTVTAVFYFVLKAFDTANLAVSTLSVTTSFVAVYLTYRRHPCYALAFAANDLVLIALWIFAATKDARYFAMILCFAAFLLNDIYSLINWKQLERKQREAKR